MIEEKMESTGWTDFLPHHLDFSFDIADGPLQLPLTFLRF